MSWEKWHYKNLTFLALGVIAAFLLSLFLPLRDLLLSLGNFGYLGAFLAGMFFVSTFTVATSAAILIISAQTLSPWEVAIVAGLGAVVGDYLIFKFVKDNLIKEVAPLYEKIGGGHITKILHTKYFSWTLPVIGALIIASPLPDELGVSLLGISKLKTYKFLALSFLLNTIGILLVVFASLAIAARY